MSYKCATHSATCTPSNRCDIQDMQRGSQQVCNTFHTKQKSSQPQVHKHGYGDKQKMCILKLAVKQRNNMVITVALS